MIASDDRKKIRVKLSKIQFPDICPVCLKEPEDLVFVTIMERRDYDYAYSSWMKGQDKTEVALNAAKGAIAFTIPTCMLHGSKSVRTFRTKMVAAVGFFGLFYPILYYLLQINVAVGMARSILEPLLGLVGTFSLLLIFLLYGLFPRALERAIHFDDVSRVKDWVLLRISNPEYRHQFMDLNMISADIVESEPTENRE
ncbi:MAG: hypothetical protein ACFFBL_01050 [Promethearchaeota archaeon]